MPVCAHHFFSRLILSAFFIFAGIGHFVAPALYLKMMPPYIPAPLFMIYASGAAEALLGALILPEKTRVPAGWGLIAILAAVFPANVYLALTPGLWPHVPEWVLWARLPFQGLFVYWVWSAALRKTRPE